jgi:hypothetical protein
MVSIAEVVEVFFIFAVLDIPQSTHFSHEIFAKFLELLHYLKIEKLECTTLCLWKSMAQTA